MRPLAGSSYERVPNRHCVCRSSTGVLLNSNKRSPPQPNADSKSLFDTITKSLLFLKNGFSLIFLLYARITRQEIYQILRMSILIKTSPVFLPSLRPTIHFSLSLSALEDFRTLLVNGSSPNNFWFGYIVKFRRYTRLEKPIYFTSVNPRPT